ncbi:MAG: BrnT family toxin [Alphaproteobacteria bacterium]|nr:BrnT family toxin [Alphaproteobacteria bacterium]
MRYNNSLKFEWDPKKEAVNIKKHDVSFEEAKHVFWDKNRIILRDKKHSEVEDRLFCYGKTERGILTVRFTMRENVIRIIGAAYWRGGRDIYEEKNRV